MRHVALAAGLILASFLPGPAGAAPPNVILVMTDDQGYGDLHCHGNEIIRTPALDRLHAESVRLTNYHVDPTCSPTRSALMTGRYSSRTGVWHTIQGRSMMAPDEITLAEVFTAAGYRTGIFGKWHLGDNFPLRPQDQGFQHVLVHGGGGVTQTPDFWGNDYFDDTYFRSDELFESCKPEKFKGYCTDIWFDNAIQFIEASHQAGKPFFCYIPTNAPHGPFHVADTDSEPYRKLGVPEQQARFWGMITNIDENMARLRARLDELQLADNTILIFTTDNGTAAGAQGAKGFNAGMRGQKGSEYDGGHRVPLFIRWPAGGIGGGRDVDVLAAHVDVRPTLVDLCGLPPDMRELPPIDGRSLAALLTFQPQTMSRDPRSDWPDRTLFVHSQRIEHPQQWRKCAVMTQRWRLVNGQELFDMSADPGQKHEIAAEHPGVVETLRNEYEAWWKSISTRFDDYVRIGIGSSHENPARLTCHDWHTNDGPVPWNQATVGRNPVANGFWAIDVTQPGRYRFTLRTRPEQVGAPLGVRAVRLNVEYEGELRGMELDIDEHAVAPGATAAAIETTLQAGPAKLQTWLKDDNGPMRGAYFVEVERLEQAAARQLSHDGSQHSLGIE